MNSPCSMITFQFIAIGSPTFLIDTGCVFFWSCNPCFSQLLLGKVFSARVAVAGGVLGFSWKVFSATVGVFCDGKWCFLCGLRVGLVIMQQQQQLLLQQQQRRRQFSATVSDVSLHGLKGCSCWCWWCWRLLPCACGRGGALSLNPPCQTNSTMPSCIKTRCCCLRLPPATHLPTTHDLIHTIISVFCNGKLPTDYDLLQYLLPNYLQHTTCYYHLLPTITIATSLPFQKHPARPDQNNKPTTATVGKAGNRSTLRLLPATHLLQLPTTHIPTTYYPLPITHYTYTTYHRWTYYLTTYNIWLTTYYRQCYQQTVAKKKGNCKKQRSEPL